MSQFRSHYSNTKSKVPLNGYKPFAKPSSSQSYSKYSEQLSQLQMLTKTVQQSLQSFNTQSNLYPVSRLSKKNLEVAHENARLKEKIKSIESQKKTNRMGLFSPSNTSLRTQETVQSENRSFAGSSESSVDSLILLKEQVKQVKAFKDVKRSQRKVTIHRKTNSITEQEVVESKTKGKKATNKIVSNALLCKICALRFN